MRGAGKGSTVTKLAKGSGSEKKNTNQKTNKKQKVFASALLSPSPFWILSSLFAFRRIVARCSLLAGSLRWLCDFSTLQHSTLRAKNEIIFG